MIRIRSMDDYKKYYELAQSNPESFWSEVASSFTWKKKWDKLQSGSFDDLNIKWFEGAKLNITENALDRHLESNGDKLAIIYEPNDPNDETIQLTYSDLHREVCKTANMFKELGIQKGDRVCFYMSMLPELLIGALACARIGAVHSVVFAGFSSTALAQRINDCTPKLLITNDQGKRGAKTIDLKAICDEALKDCSCVEHCLVFRHTGSKINMQSGRDVWWNDLIEKQSPDCPVTEMDSEDPLFILYTSGSTGKPKGLMHTTAGYMVYTAYSFQNVFQVEEDDLFWCTADIGWITGHSYMTYGPLLSGATQVMFEGVPTYPDAGRFWDVVDKHKVTHFYTAPTAIRALESCGTQFVEGHDLSSLKVLGSVGEPINVEAWSWYNKHIGKEKCPIVDTWWQTETGGIMISPLAGITETIPSFATRPLPGIFPILVDEKGAKLEGPTSGNLCIERPWPSIARTVYGDHDRYKQVYFSSYPGRYFTGDGCLRDEKENYRITGRVDDVLNVSGHRLGTAEIENALNEHEMVVESAVVGYPHDIKGQGIYAYVILLNPPSDESTFKGDLGKLVNKLIGPIARPDKIQIVPGLPKTRSGKIMRRILRKIAEGDPKNLGDISTLLNPEVVEEVIGGAL